MQQQLTRRSALSGLALLALGAMAPGCTKKRKPLPEPLDRRVLDALTRGADHLVGLQSDDGAFRSSVYGLLRSGESLTPFVGTALDALPEALGTRTRSVSAAAHAWLLASIDASPTGMLGFAGPATDYPVYATALALTGLAHAGFAADPRVRKAEAALRKQQLREEDGWAGHPALGGFFMGHRRQPVPPDAGHVDLSMTRRAAEALRALGAGPEDPALVGIRAFVARCRGSNGGFVYTPHELVLNKAGCEPEAEGPPCRGYGSATADGVLALLACGAADAPEAADAARFLASIHRVDRNPGLEGAPMEAFAPAMVGSYRAGAAAVFLALGGPEGWRVPLIEAVLAEQRPDGSWQNGSRLQKEDDPLIAGSFALLALSRARRPDRVPSR